MADNHCPSAEILKCHALGTLGVDESSSVDLHLSQCSVCSVTLAGFDAAEDTLVSQLGAKVETPQEDDAGQLRHALRNIKAYLNDPSKTVLESRPRQDAPPIPEALRDYKLLGRLGTGGMGDVYKALHVKLDKIVALKVLHSERIHDPSAVARFDREIRIAGKLEHPNIVRATDAGEAEGRHFLVMEYVEGFNLADVVRLLGQLPVADACEMIRQAAVGLDHVHHHGLVHRDIKPSNLILTRDTARSHASSASNSQSNGVVKILDLGLALLHEAARPGTGELTHSGMIVGTIDYMAPEQGNDTHHVDIRADVYSLGATLFKLLTAEAPFTGGGYDRPLKKLAAIAMEVAPDLTSRRHDVPPELAAIVAKMLAKSPDERFATPAELAAALAPFAAGSNLEAILDRATEGRRNASDNVEVRALETNLSGSANTTRAADQSLKHHPAEAASQPVPASHLATAGSADQERSSWKDFRVRSAVAAALLLLAAGLVYIIQTDKGDIIITADDENVSVSVDDNRGNTVDDEISWDAGKKTFHLSTGRYTVKLTDLDAKKFEIADSEDGRSKEIRLTRGDRKVITIQKRAHAADESVAKELPPVAEKDAQQGLPVAAEAAAKEVQKPFVVRQAGGKTQSEWTTFAEAILAFNSGECESIEVRGNGPFRIPPVMITAKSFRIRPAPGFRPEFKPVPDSAPHPGWIDARAASVEIEDCDWTGFPGSLFASSASETQPWRFRNCRFTGSTPVVSYAGLSLQFENCLLSGVSSLPRLGEKTELEFRNNVVRAVNGFVLGAGGQTLNLADNTLVVDGFVFVCEFGPGTKPTKMTLERNILQSGPILLMTGNNVHAEQIKETIEWHARDNTYSIGADVSYRVANGTFGFFVDGAVGHGTGHVFAANFDAWKKFWGSQVDAADATSTPEPGSQNAEAHFNFDFVRYAPPEDVVDKLRRDSESIHSQLARLGAEAHFGPKWNTVGPGNAYVESLKASGQTIAPDSLRPSPLDSGPIIVASSDGKAPKGFISLKEAVQQTDSQNVVIEIRTDAPIEACAIPAGETGRSVTIKTAPGYRPNVRGNLQGNRNLSLTLEGLYLVGSVHGELASLRMQNCAISVPKGHARNSNLVDVSIHASAEPAAIRNSVLPGRVHISTHQEPGIEIENSVLSQLATGTGNKAPFTVRLSQSLFWNPMQGLCLAITGGSAIFQVQQTWFETGVTIIQHKIWNGRVIDWKGSRNLYVVGGESWSADDSIISLDGWRKQFNTSEEGSIAAPMSPAASNWGLMPDSSGDSLGPKGKDRGADVLLIGSGGDLEARRSSGEGDPKHDPTDSTKK